MIMGVGTQLVSGEETKIGKLNLQALIDSGSVRSLISIGDFQKLNGGVQLLS
jgi:hypothetical protein